MKQTLLFKYRNLNKSVVEKGYSPYIGIVRNKVDNLFTAKYLHGGVDWSSSLVRNARGLTFTPSGKVVIRGFEKFFNYKQMDVDYYKELYSEEFIKKYSEIDLTDENVKLNFYEKLDGSLILISQYKGRLIASTTSSSNNPYTKIVLKHFNSLPIKKDLIKYLKATNQTLAFELISPLNQIVVKYDVEDYVLIGAINNKSGIRKTQQSLDIIAKRFKFSRPTVYNMTLKEIFNTLSTMENIEGFVLENTHGKLLKFKADSWFELKEAMDVFFGYKLTQHKTEIIVNSYLNDEIDDLLALEAQNQMYRKTGFIKTVLDEIKEIEEYYNHLYNITKEVPNRDLVSYFEENNLPMSAVKTVFTIRNHGDWRIRRKSSLGKYALTVKVIDSLIKKGELTSIKILSK